MAIGNPTAAGTGWAQVTTTGQTTATSGSFTPGANTLVVAIFQNANGTTDPGAPTTIVDSQGSPVSFGAGTPDASVAVAAVAGHLSVWSHYYASSPGAITLKATFPSSNYTNGFIYTIANAASTTPLDQKGTSSSTAATTMAVTTAGNCAQADEIAFGCYTRGSNIAAETTWPLAGWTSLTNLTNATRSAGLSIEYINGVTSGATITAGGTLSASSGITRAVVTYKGVSGVTQTFAFAATGVSTPTFTLAGMTDTVVFATTGKSAPAFTLAGMTDTVTLATTGKATVTFTPAGMSDTFTVATTGHSVPTFTLAGMTDTVTVAAKGVSVPAFSLAGMTDLVTFTAAGLSAPSFGVASTPAPSLGGGAYDQTPLQAATHSS